MKQVIERCDICKKIWKGGPKFNGSVTLQRCGDIDNREHLESCDTCMFALKACYSDLLKDLPEVTA